MDCLSLSFREFYYIQMEKYARQSIAEGITAEQVDLTPESELYKILNLHYNRNNQIEVGLALRRSHVAVTMIVCGDDFIASLLTGTKKLPRNDTNHSKGIHQSHITRQGQGAVMEETHLQGDSSSRRHGPRVLQITGLDGTVERLMTLSASEQHSYQSELSSLSANL